MLATTSRQAITHVRHLSEGGRQSIPDDSGQGRVFRPFVNKSRTGGQISTLETLYDFFMDDVPDPDEALKLDPDFLTKLYQHPFVAADMEKRRNSVAGLNWRIDANPSAKDRKAAEFVAQYVTEVWNSIPNIAMLYYEMQTAVLEGGIGHEWLWKHRDGVEVPYAFRMVAKDRFLFDREGNMALRTRNTPVWGTYVKESESKKWVNFFPRGKFQYHVHRRKPGRWVKSWLEGYQFFGEGEDVSLYYPITFDNYVLRFRMKWLEKFGIPPTVIYHPNNVLMRDDITRVADSLRNESVISVPRVPAQDKEGMWAIQQLPVPNMSNDAFSKFPQEWTRPIVKDILLGGDGGQYAGSNNSGGGYSSHMSQMDSGANVFYKMDAKKIDATLNSEIIQAIALARFPNLPETYMPIHRIEPKEERDRLQEIQIASQAAQLIPLSEDELYERAGFRKPKAGEKTVGGPPPAQGQPGQPPQAPAGMPGGGSQTAAGGMPKTPIGQGTPQ